MALLWPLVGREEQPKHTNRKANASNRLYPESILRNSELYVIFHKQVRVFYQGFQTRENNGIHEAVYQAIFIVLENL
jgi:hypothetical protein